MIDRRVLKIDVDRRFSACKWTKWCERVVETLQAARLEPARVEIRDTRRGHHVLITLRDPLGSDAQVVAAQAMLGSDSVREAFNLRRCIDGRLDDWNVLYEQKHRHDGIHKTKPNVPFGRILLRAMRREWPACVVHIEPGPGGAT